MRISNRDEPPIQLTRREYELALKYVERIHSSPSVADARIYNRKLKSLMEKGKMRARENREE